MGDVLTGYLTPLRDTLLRYYRESADLRWRSSTGQAAATATAGAPDLVLSGDLVHLALDHDDRAAAREFAVWYFRERLAPATRAWRTAQQTTTAPIDGRDLAQSQLLALTRRTTGTDRDRAAAALRDVTGRLATARHRWLAEHAAAGRDLGFANHAMLVRALHPEVDAWTATASRWLATTRDDYLEEWRRWQEIDRLPRPRVADTRLVASGVHAPTAAADPIAATLATLAGWGFAEETSRVLVDTAARPGKVGFAFCSAVDPPRDVRISAVGGTAVTGYATLVHEFGHALHFTAGVRDAVQLWRASPAMSEAFGFALELVVREPAWQRCHFGVALSVDDVARVRFARESVRRTVAAGLCFEMLVHEGHPDPEAAFVALFSTEFGVEVDGATAFDRLQTYLEGQPCYPLLYVQAFTVRDLLWDRLVTAAGRDWFIGPQARPAVEALLPMLDDVAPHDWTPAARRREPAPPARP